jgi:PRTRC genetic system ThiF family protein
VTIHRLNQFYGLDWTAQPHRYEHIRRDSRVSLSPGLLVSCVDTRGARRAIHERLFAGDGRGCYWLDLGNSEATAQVVLGESVRRSRHEQGTICPRLPCVTELFPELLDASVPDDDAPSCSMRMSLASQGLFVNDVVVRFAAQLLYELFSSGRIRHHGVLINLDSKRCAPIDIDPLAWRRFGYEQSEQNAEAVAGLPQAA